MEIDVRNGKILYYCREKLYGKLQEIIKDGLVRSPEDSFLLFFNGFSLLLNKRYQEAIRELNPHQDHSDISLPVVMCLIHAHKHSVSVDREALQQLDARLKNERRQATLLSLYFSAQYLFFTDKFDKASDITDKVLKMDPKFTQALILKGWIDIHRYPKNLTQKIADNFEMALENENLDGTLGLVALKFLKKENTLAISILEKNIAKQPYLDILLIEKLKNELALLNWDRVSEIIEELLLKYPDNVLVMKYKIFYTLCKKGDCIDAADFLDKYFNLLQKTESKNAAMFYDTSKLFSYVCGRSGTVLMQTYRFLKYAAELNPSNIDYLTELGYQCFLQNKFKDAVHFFKSATKVDDNSINALCGLTLCQMTESGPSEQIEQQIELLNELLGSNNKDPLLLLMMAKLESKNPDRVLKILNEICNIHFAKSHFLPYGIEHLKALNPDFLLNIVDEYHQYIPKKPLVITDTIISNHEENLSTPATQIILLLENITKSCPGLAPALYRLAKIQFLYGKINVAIKLAQDLVENIDRTYASAHLLLSQIFIQQKLYSKAEQCLEICLSYNFKIRENPMYHLLQGIIYGHEKKYMQSLESFTSAISLTNSKNKTSSLKTKTNDEYELSLPDRATLYLELIKTHSILNQHSEATKVMQEANEEFSYSTEEVRLTIANAELALCRKDVDHAIELLSQIKPEQHYYLQAHTKLAHIYLKEKNDREMFAVCFKEVVKNNPGSDGHTMLGDAYMSIHDPKHAVEAYEKALIKNPKDLNLIKKLGKAFIKIHLYWKAEKHYIEAIESLSSAELKLDLADLYMKLKQFDKAEEILRTELQNPATVNASDYMSMKFQSNVLMMIAKVRERNNNDANKRATLIALKDARENQVRLVKRAQFDSRPDLEEEKKILSEICASLAAQYVINKSIDNAIQTYKEALQYIPQHPPVLLALSKLYLQVNEPDLCQQTCAILLNADPENEAASVMMADLAFKKNDFENASFHLKQLLTRQISYWTALERLIDVQRRLGDIEEVATFITKAQESGYSQEAGFLYCAGLHARYNGDPNGALRYWGRARQGEGHWAHCAAIGVIKVCISPGSEALPPPLHDDSSSDSPDDSEYRDTRSFALGMAERLLNELLSTSGFDSTEILELKLLGFRLTLARRKKNLVEAALRQLLQMASEEGGTEDIGIAVVIASTYMVLKQIQRARNQLKRFARTPWSPDKAEWLEMCWVLLGECFLNSGNSSSNVDAARESIERALKYNKSCSQAYEYLAFLAEKDQLYKIASQYYENAWKYGGQGNSSMGLKYAHCLLKAKKYGEAILVSRDVLIAHPDCPKIRKDVMEKASSLLRM